jgi:O-antigen/teichoic acid export membrane protein
MPESRSTLHSYLARFRQAVRILRLRPFDTSTEAGRAHERLRRAALSSLAALGGKTVTVLTTLVSVPLTLGYLGQDRFGLWMTISSAIAMLAFADLGIGNGLINAISEAHGKNDLTMAQRSVSSAFFLLGGISVALSIVFALTYPLVNWASIFRVSTALARTESGPTMLVFAGCFFAQIPVGIIVRIQVGYQEGFISNLWSALGSLLGLAGVLLATALHGGLPWLVFAMSGGPVVAGVANGIVLLGWQRPSIRPRWVYVTRQGVMRLLQLGGLFLALQIAMSLAYSSDNMVAAQVFGSATVTSYAVPMRLFSIAPMLMGMLQAPLWPAYGEAIARGDTIWVRRTLVRALVGTFASAAAVTLPLVLGGPWIIHMWVGDQVRTSMLLLTGMGIWAILSSTGTALGMYLNGANVLRFQVVTSLLMAVAALVLKVFLARAIGVAGIIWGTVIAYAIFVVIPSAVFVRRMLAFSARGTSRL